MKQLLLAVFVIVVTPTFSQEFKVVGYLATWNFEDYADKIDWDRLTHVNLAFANPDANGNFLADGENIDPVVAIAHQHGVKVFISLAGGYLTPAWQSAWNNWMQPSQLPAFTQKIKQYVQAHQLDGVDIDLEWNHVNDLYSPFILALKPTMDSLGLPLTAALPGGYRYPQINAEALAAFDWVNLMIYDLTGPWNPDDPGQHSPYSWAENCLQYWQNQGLPGERQTLGVPFYGYDFVTEPVSSFSFADMVALNANYAELDQVGQAFYNGRPTIHAKTLLAQEETAGIMIWELGQDAFDEFSEFSLLRVIDEVVHPISANSESYADNLLRLYPNPAGSFLNIEHGFEANAKLQIMDLQGKVWWENEEDEAHNATIQIEALPKGFYSLKMTSNNAVRTAKFVKS